MANDTFVTNQLTALAAAYSYVCWFADHDAPTSADLIASKHELARSVATSVVSGNVITTTYSLASGSGNCLNTTVSSSTTSSSFTLTSTSGLSVGDRIEIAMATGTVERKVLTLPGGNVVTINAALTSAPAGGIIVRQMISQRAIITGGSASANTGVIADCKQFIIFKSATTTGLTSLTWKTTLS